MTVLEAIVGIPKKAKIPKFLKEHINQDRKDITGDDYLIVDGKNILNNSKYQYFVLTIHVAVTEDLIVKLREKFREFVYCQVYD